MIEADQRHPVARKRLIVQPPSGFQATVRTDINYAEVTNEARNLEIFYPPTATDTTPAVLLVSGLSDVGAKAVLGCRINEMASFRDWASLMAAHGLIAITYETGPDPAADAKMVTQFLQQNGETLSIDAGQLGLWSCSAHVPNALGLLMTEPRAFRCAAMLYGFMLDLDDSTGVAEAQRLWRFANPATSRGVEELPPDVPLLVARAGHDANPSLNDSIDRFIAHTLRRNLPITLVNHASAPHSFDLDDDTETSRQIVHQVAAFLRSQLRSGRN